MNAYTFCLDKIRMSNHQQSRPSLPHSIAQTIRRLSVPILLFWLAVAAITNILCRSWRRSAKRTTWR